MKKLIKEYLPISSPIYHQLKSVFSRWKYSPPSVESIFSNFYYTNAWGGSESVSGEGSDLVNTAVLRQQLPSLLIEFNVKTLLDAPCGDFNWMKEIQFDLDKYIGADIVPEMIVRNRKLFASHNREFKVLNITKDKLPQVDVIFCRDCLVHLSYKHIAAALKNFKRSGSQYLLTTTFTRFHQNTDIVTGDWRRLNLELPPFSFPKPIKIINEGYTAQDAEFSDKSLGLWKLKDIKNIKSLSLNNTVDRF